MERRDFIKRSCGVCAGLLGIAAVLPVVQSCAPLNYIQAVKENNSFFIPYTAFVEDSKLVIIKNNELAFNIAVVKLTETSYKALEMRCTHQTNALVATKNSFVCTLHGSTFDLTGKVITSPASSNLKEFKIEQNNEGIHVFLS